jgi:hypothetical protein
MGILYTTEEIQDVLRTLRIKPIDGNLVSTQEAAKILSWRAFAEQGIDHQYPDTAVRRHVQQGNLKIARQVNVRFNLFKAEDVFDLVLAPKRALARQRELSSEEAA